MSRKDELTSRDWFGKAAAGLVLGLALALGLSGLFAWFGPGGIDAGGGKAQFNMWLMAPVWALVLAFCFFFRSPRRAWAWLAIANLLTYGLLYGGRWLLD